MDNEMVSDDKSTAFAGMSSSRRNGSIREFSLQPADGAFNPMDAVLGADLEESKAIAHRICD